MVNGGDKTGEMVTSYGHIRNYMLLLNPKYHAFKMSAV